MNKIKKFDSFVRESHYSYLGGNSNFSDNEMRKNIIEPNFGNNYDSYIMFKDTEYEEIKKMYGDTSNWENLWRSSSYQTYADISPDGRVIKATVFDNGGIVGAIYVKKD